MRPRNTSIAVQRHGRGRCTVAGWRADVTRLSLLLDLRDLRLVLLLSFAVLLALSHQPSHLRQMRLIDHQELLKRAAEALLEKLLTRRRHSAAPAGAAELRYLVLLLSVVLGLSHHVDKVLIAGSSTVVPSLTVVDLTVL